MDMRLIRRSKKKLSPRRIKVLKALGRKIDAEDSVAVRAKARKKFNRRGQRRNWPIVFWKLRIRRS